MTSKNRNSLTYAEVLFRPVYELNAAYVYVGAGIATGGLAQLTDNTWTVTALISGGLLMTGIYNLAQSMPLLKRQLNLFINKLEFIELDKLRKINRATFNSKPENFRYTDCRELYFADGFDWGPHQAQRAYQLMDLSPNLEEMNLPMLTKPFINGKIKTSKGLGGYPWLYGIGDKPKHQMVAEETFFGHTFVTGQVGSGKTTLLRLLSTGFLHLGHSLIVLDPKGDASLREGIRKECKFLGKQFYEFCPAKPSQSYYIDILKNFAIPTEIPTRIANLLKNGSASSDSFIEFGWQTISQVTDGMIYCGEAPKLTEIYRYMRSGKQELLGKVLSRFYAKFYGKNWRVDYLDKMMGLGDSELSSMVAYYTQKIPSTSKESAVEDIIQYVTHNAEHAQKMLASVFPLFKVLCSNPLDTLLSPRNDVSPEKVIDIKRVIMNGDVIYCSLNSMSDPRTAGYLARLLLADVAACLGDRYNYGDGKERRLTVVVDEVHAAISGNESLIGNLAQGRAAMAQFLLATQTIPDVVANTDEATAQRYLGLCNNFISMKVTDNTTQEYVAKQFNKTNVQDIGIQYSIQSDTKSALTEFSGGYRENITKSREDMFPESLIASLPKLQFVCRLANGQKLFCKLPIIKESKHS